MDPSVHEARAPSPPKGPLLNTAISRQHRSLGALNHSLGTYWGEEHKPQTSISKDPRRSSASKLNKTVVYRPVKRRQNSKHSKGNPQTYNHQALKNTESNGGSRVFGLCYFKIWFPGSMQQGRVVRITQTFLPCKEHTPRCLWPIGGTSTMVPISPQRRLKSSVF